MYVVWKYTLKIKMGGIIMKLYESEITKENLGMVAEKIKHYSNEYLTNIKTDKTKYIGRAHV